MEKIAVAIPSYKFRYCNDKKHHILMNLDDIDKKYDIYVFLQTNDETVQEYLNVIKETDNIHIVIADVDNMYKKRQYMFDYLKERGYNGYFQIDDDIMYVAFKIDETTKRETSNTYRFYKCPFSEMLDKMVSAAKEYDAGYVTVSRWGYIGWKKPNEVGINHQVNPAQFGYFSIDKMAAAGVKYTTDGSVWDDVDMILQLFQNEINCITVFDYMFEPLNITWKDMEVGTLDYNTRKVQMLSINLAKKWHADIEILKKRDVLHEKIKFNKYWGLKELPPIDDYKKKLYELCDEGDFDKIREYIINNKNGKKK